MCEYTALQDWVSERVSIESIHYFDDGIMDVEVSIFGEVRKLKGVGDEDKAVLNLDFGVFSKEEEEICVTTKANDGCDYIKPAIKRKIAEFFTNTLYSSQKRKRLCEKFPKFCEGIAEKLPKNQRVASELIVKLRVLKDLRKQIAQVENEIYLLAKGFLNECE